jgi:transcriptional regulator with XRE-family HTH domain
MEMVEVPTMHQPTTNDTGRALRRARELSGMTERSAARELGVRRSRLRGWEQGATPLDADELSRAIRLYSADLDQIWPDRRPIVSDALPGVLVVGDERIEVDGSNRSVLTRYLAAVRRQRGLASDATVELRADDITSLAGVLDLTDAALESELGELLQLTPAGARVTARALAVGALVAIGAVTVVGGSWLSPAGATTVDASAAAAEAPAAVFAPEVAAVEVSDQAAVQFAPTPADPDAPVDAEVVVDDEATPSPFSTEPSAAPVELAPAVFATAPATEWSYVEDAPEPPAATAELPAG